MSKRSELEAENTELRERWRSCVDTIDAIRSCLYDEQTSEYVARSFHAHYESEPEGDVLDLADVYDENGEPW